MIPCSSSFTFNGLNLLLLESDCPFCKHVYSSEKSFICAFSINMFSESCISFVDKTEVFFLCSFDLQFATNLFTQLNTLTNRTQLETLSGSNLFSTVSSALINVSVSVLLQLCLLFLVFFNSSSVNCFYRHFVWPLAFVVRNVGPVFIMYCQPVLMRLFPLISNLLDFYLLAHDATVLVLYSHEFYQLYLL